MLNRLIFNIYNNLIIFIYNNWYGIFIGLNQKSNLNNYNYIIGLTQYYITRLKRGGGCSA